MAFAPETPRSAWLAKWDNLIGQRASRPVKYMHLGDSITEGMGSTLTDLEGVDHVLDKMWTAREQIEFENKWPTTGQTAFGFEFVNAYYKMMLPAGPDVTKAALTYTGTASTVTQGGLVGKARAVGDGTTATMYRYASTFEVYVNLGNTSASAKLYIDDSTSIAAQRSGVAGLVKITVSGLDGSKRHKLKIVFNNTGTKGTLFYGVAVYRGTENKGIQVWGGANSGSSTFMFSSVLRGPWEEMVAMVKPDVIAISWLTNDMNSGNGRRMPDVYQADTLAMVDKLKAAAPNALIFIQVPQQYKYTNQYYEGTTWEGYVETNRWVASQRPNVFVEPISNHVAMGANLSDGIHPNDTGYLEYGKISMRTLDGQYESGSPSDTAKPSVPTNFRSTAKSTNTIALAWTASTDNVGVTGYRIFRDNVAIRSSGTTLTFTDTGLTANRSYTYTIDAFDAAGNYSSRASLSVTTTASSDTVAPGAPTLAATVQSSTSVALSWSGSTDNVGVTNYRIFANGALLTRTTTAATTYTASGLTAGTKYTFEVYAADAAGNISPSSNSASVTTTPVSDTTPPTTPGAIIQGTVTASSVALSWGASTDAGGLAGYRLFQDGKQLAATITGTSYTVTGLATGTAYAFVVKAFDKAGNISAGTAALIVTTTPPADDSGANIPTNLTIQAVSVSTATISWTAPADGSAVSYNLFRSGTPIAQGVTATTYTATDLEPNTKYVFGIRAVNASGIESPTSQGRAATTLPGDDSQAPTVPTNIVVGATTNTSIALSWSESTDNVAVAGYKILLDGVEMNETATQTTLTITGLTANTSYSVTIKAFDEAGNDSAASAAVIAKTSTTTDTTRPSPPNGFVSSDITSTSVVLSWNASIDNVGIAGYIVFKDGTSIDDTTATTFTVTGLNPSTSYGFVVKSVDTGGNISLGSAALYVTTSAVVDNEAPSAPGAITSSNVTATGVTLTWGAATDNVGVTNYYVYRNSVRIAVLENVLTYNATGLAASTNYGFFVRAVDGAGNLGTPSATKTVTTSANADTQRPTTPQTLSATNINMTSFTLSWTASTDNVGVTGYEVYRNNTRVTTVTNGTSYNATNLAAGTAYTYYVVALDLAGNKSNGSATLTVTTAPDTSVQPPSAPSNLNVLDTTLTSITIGWTVPESQPNGLSGYVVLYDGDEFPVSASSTQATVTGLSSSTMYQFTVVAVSSTGVRSEESAPLNASTDKSVDTTAPTRPTNLVASQVSDRSASLTWTASTDDTAVFSYSIYLDGDEIDNIEAFSVGADGEPVYPSTLTYVAPFLSPETTYSFYVRAQDAAGNVSSGSDILNVATLPPRTGADVKVWTGANWNTAEVKIWNGTAWVIKPVKTWNGSSWL
jgi:chitodextrinase